MRKVARIIPFLVWAGIICWLSLKPGGSLGSRWYDWIPHGDKVMHAGAYGLLGLLAMIAGRSTERLKSMWIALAVCAGLGLVIEVLQHTLTETRHFEVLDIIANIIGSFLGIAGFKLFFKRRHYGS